jgi:hypothetical protein
MHFPVFVDAARSAQTKPVLTYRSNEGHCELTYYVLVDNSCSRLVRTLARQFEQFCCDELRGRLENEPQWRLSTNGNRFLCLPPNRLPQLDPRAPS